jgi:hypothetical protein
VSERRRHVKVGDMVLVPWGIEEPVHARVIEVWGNPPSQVRVQLLLDEEDERCSPATRGTAHPRSLTGPRLVEERLSGPSGNRRIVVSADQRLYVVMVGNAL